MAYLVEVTLSSSNKETVNFQSREVGISLTYRLEPSDWASSEGDVLTFVEEKMQEVRAAHALAWQKVREPDVPHPKEATSRVTEPKVVEAVAQVPPADAKVRGTTQSPSIKRIVVDDEIAGEQVVDDESRAEVEKKPCVDDQSHVSDDGGPSASPAQVQALLSLLRRGGLDEWECSQHLQERCGLQEFEQLSAGQAAIWLLDLQQVERKRVQSLQESTR